MEKIQNYLKIGFEILAVGTKNLLVRQIDEPEKPPLELEKTEDFPSFTVGNMFITEVLRGEIRFYY